MIEIRRVSSCHVLEVNAHDGPIRAQRNLFGPLDDHHRLLAENIFEPERFEIPKTHDAVQIDVIDARRVGAFIFVHQRERGAGHVLFARRAQAADDPFGQRGLPCPEIAGKQNQRRRLQPRADFAAAPMVSSSECVTISRARTQCRRHFALSHAASRRKIADRRAGSQPIRSPAISGASPISA